MRYYPGCTTSTAWMAEFKAEVQAACGATPPHSAVGHFYRAHDGHIYLCQSHDPSCGLWMIREDCPAEHADDTHSKWRRNVSERVVGRTFHQVKRG